MKDKIEKITEMSATDLMVFVKECCKENEEVTRKIAEYTGCVLQWAEEVDDFMIFTVLAGIFDGVHVHEANEYITVSFNRKTELLLCLSHYLHNYGGYRIYFSNKDNCIKQEIGYGFGSWKYADLNLDLTEKTSYTKQDFGCCCG